MNSDSSDLPKTCYLERKFRDLLFSKAYEQAGSLANIGKEMGYKARKGLNRVARDMWLGKIGIPRNRMFNLSQLTGMPLDVIIPNLVIKDNNLQSTDWNKSYQSYKMERTES